MVLVKENSNNRSSANVKKEVKEDKLNFKKLVWIFFISCEVGYLVETIWCYIRHGYIESRQSLVYSHLSVAYGLGAIVLTLVLYKIKDSRLTTIFAVSYIAGTVTEYICSLGQELLFGSVAWDYSNVPFNINGRVCLLYSIFWGFLGVLWIKVCYPLMSRLVDKIPKNFSKAFVVAFIVFFIFDSVMSGAAAFRMNQRDAGVPATNIFTQYLDKHFSDERMHEIYANSKSVR